MFETDFYQCPICLLLFSSSAGMIEGYEEADDLYDEEWTQPIRNFDPNRTRQKSDVEQRQWRQYPHSCDDQTELASDDASSLSNTFSDLECDYLRSAPIEWDFPSMTGEIKPITWNFTARIPKSVLSWRFSRLLPHVTPVDWLFSEQVPVLGTVPWTFSQQLSTLSPVGWQFAPHGYYGALQRWHFARASDDTTTIIWGFPSQLASVTPVPWRFTRQSNDAQPFWGHHWNFCRQTSPDGNVAWRFVQQTPSIGNIRWEFQRQMSTLSAIAWWFVHTVAKSGPLKWDFQHALVGNTGVPWRFVKQVSTRSSLSWNFPRCLPQYVIGHTVSSVNWDFHRNLKFKSNIRWSFVPALGTDMRPIGWNFERMTIQRSVDTGADHEEALQEIRLFKERYCAQYQNHKQSKTYRDRTVSKRRLVSTLNL